MNAKQLQVLNDTFALQDFCKCAYTHSAAFDYTRPMESVTHLKTYICDYFKLTERKLESGARDREYVIARFIVAFLMYFQLQKTFKEIGKCLGGRDHTTALHAVTEMCKTLISNSEDEFTTRTKREFINICTELNQDYSSLVEMAEYYIDQKIKKLLAKREFLKEKYEPIVNTVVNLTPPIDRKSFTTYSNRQFV